MKIDSYLHSLLPSVEQIKVKEQLRSLSEEMSEKTIPPFKAAADYFTPQYKFKSRAMQGLQKRFDRKLDRREKNFILSTLTALELNVKNINKSLELVDEYYSSDILKDGMSYAQVTLLQYVESLQFVSMYSRRLLLVAYGVEAMNVPDERGLSRDLRWVEKNFDHFLICLQAHFGGAKKLEKSIEDIPDAKATPESVGVLKATAGLNKIDPMGFSFINAKLNPIYHLRVGWEKIQRHFYQSASEEKQLLEFKLMNLKLEAEGKPDARLQETITKVEARVEKLHYEMQEYENG